uniref:Uncharacterized protein n=1 Tax=Avena sativa TaxID=4498 RepID=A0ACD5VZF6_AVESA
MHRLKTGVMATASFVTHLQKPRELRVLEFRAPPPSPVTGVLTSSSSGSPEHGDGNEDDEVSQFLRCSARVPVLRLPERAIPRKKKSKAASAWAPPVIDMRLLESGGPAVEEALRSAAVAFGCFQVVGHGVDVCLAGGDDDEDGEELWWSPSKGDQSRNRAHDLFAQLEETATQIMDTLQRDSVGAADSSLAIADRNGTSLLCIRTHHGKQCGSGSAISQDDILRTLINTSRCPRALALHLFPGASTFHVFSRRGCSSFRPLDGAVVVTVGDQLQAWSSGLYKSVAGKPAYSNDDLQGGAVISAEFLHTSSGSMASEHPEADAREIIIIIPLKLQIIAAACLVLAYHFLLSCLYAIW